MISKNTSMDVLSRKMEIISSLFFESKKQIGEKLAMSDVINEDDMDSHSLFIKKVEDTYNQLDSLDKLFINNEYFYQDYPFWWSRLYTASTYYRYKKKAVIRFLRLFFNET